MSVYAHGLTHGVGVVNGCDLLSQMSTKHALENADAELSEPQEKKRLGM